MPRTRAERKARSRAVGWFAGVAAMLLAGTGCDVYKVPSSWRPAPVTVDGDSADWGDLPFFKLTGQDVRVGACNDSTDLYLFVSTGRPGLVAQALAGELTLWFGTGSAKDRARGLRLRELPEGDAPARALTPEHLVELKGHDLAVVANRTDRTDGPAVAMVLDQGWLTCEVRLPLALIAGPGEAAGSPGDTLGLGLQIAPGPAAEAPAAEGSAGEHAAPRPADGGAPGRAPGLGGGHHGMGGMGGGGGMMGGGRGGFGHGLGGSHRERATNTETREFWFSIRLAPTPVAGEAVK